MAKKAQPWYWEERKSWYVTMNGRRHPLGEHPEGAARPVKSKKTGRWNTPEEIDGAFRRLLSGRAASEAGAAPAGDYVSAPLQAFLKWCKQNRAATTTARYFDFLDSFERRWHTLTVDALTARHVTEWLDGQKDWNATTKRNAITALQRAFNWAVRNLGLTANPIKGMEKPQPRRRTEVVSPADFDALLAEVADEPFRDLLVVSWDSGARPFELKDLEGRHVHAKQQRAVIPAAEAKGRRHVRTIYFPTERSMDVIRRLCAVHPSGPLFLNRRGRKWTGMAVKCRFEDLQTDLGIKEMERKGVASQVTDEAVAEFAKTLSPTRTSRKTGGEVTKKEKELLAEARRKLVAAEARPHAPRVTHYALRHSFVTRKLVAGVDSHVVASLAGHRDTSMVDRVYSHVADDARFMLEQAKKGG